MQIMLRSFWRIDKNIEINISKDIVLSKLIDPNSTSHEFDSDSDEFEHFLDITRDMLEGCWFQSLMQFNKDEVAHVNMFQLDCRGKLLKETRSDEEFNLQNLHNTEMLTIDEHIKIKLVNRISLSKIDLQQNMIGGTTLLEEFVISDFVLKIFNEAGLSGFSTIPIYNPKSKSNYDNFFQLYTESIMPLSELNISTIVREEDGGNYFFRELGCLTYKLKGNDLVNDFNRTAENWASNNMPIWIVTSKTKKCYDENKLKGWYFRPVLQKDTPLYLEYIEKWEDLFKRVNVNSKNRIS